MFKLQESDDRRMEAYANSIYDYLMSNDLMTFDKYDYDDFALELDAAINNGEIVDIPELEREDSFKLAISMSGESDYDDSMDGDHDSTMRSIGWGSDEDYGGSNFYESTVKDANEIIKMLSESLASRKAKKLGLVHVGFGNYAEEPGSSAQYKTVNGKLKKVKGGAPKKVKKQEPKKDKPKEKEEPKKDIKPKKSGVTDVRRVSGEKFTYEFQYNGRKFKFTLNKLERKELKGEGSIMDIIKTRMKKKEARKKTKLFKKGEHVK